MGTIPQPGYRPWPEWCSWAEFLALLNHRRKCIEQCTAQEFGGRPLPVAWRVGWRAELRYAGRDRDGSLLATITITGPQRYQKWLQKVRLVREERLNLHRR
jgi:hypothetical protein